MEKFSKFLWIAFVALTMTFASCSDEKDEPEPVNPDEPTISTVFPMGVPKSIGDWSFEVDKEGRVAKLIDLYDDGSIDQYFSIEYGEFIRDKKYDAVMKYFSDWDDKSEDYAVFMQLNKDGLVTYAHLYEYWDEEDEEDYSDYSEWEFEYNSDGQLTQIKYFFDEDSYKNNDFVLRLNYQDGNIIESIHKDEYGTSKYKWLYTNLLFKQPVINKSGIICMVDGGEYFYCEFLYGIECLNITGLLGKGPKNVPMGKICIEDGDEDPETEYYWEFNSELLPIKFDWLDDNGKPEDDGYTIRW